MSWMDPPPQAFEMQEGITLSKDQLKVLRKAFDTFDTEKKARITCDSINTILDMLGHATDAATVRNIVQEIDHQGAGTLSFDQFCTLASKFMTEEEEDSEAIKTELREAFRLYDKEGNGYITTEVLREILSELDNNMSDEELDQMIDEIDADGSGTVDFDEFMEVMTG
ncbi:troponin C, isoallergen Bla g 6.0101-like [Adelges cooleyi]|uniref:troponin C, isoallergen Bla g 6.0101-like n=1 Tax=Adelges cooleyi TaxID=133065 RepID=UPI00217F5FE3|nr:troponin C, isoallergen Bla g 6.0101-like [Adelges cooleyi]XP_050430524.1 troponin C, isoallergen Bla g 6.0101-like [Adelges cooleyi]